MLLVMLLLVMLLEKTSLTGCHRDLYTISSTLGLAVRCLLCELSHQRAVVDVRRRTLDGEL